MAFLSPQAPPAPGRRVPGKGRVTRAAAQQARQAKHAGAAQQVMRPAPGRPVRHSAKWPARPFAVAGLLYAAAIALTVVSLPTIGEVPAIIVGSAATVVAFVGEGLADERSNTVVIRYAILGAFAALWFALAVATGFASFATPAGQGLFAVLPLAQAVRLGYKHAHREQPPAKEMLAIEGPKPEPKPEPAAKSREETRFREEICVGQFAGLEVVGFRRLGENGERGFTFKVICPPQGKVTVSDLNTLQHVKAMARIWETTPVRIEIGYDTEGDLKHNPSELRGVVTMNRVLPPTVRRARRPDLSICTYDHSRGTVEIGDFPSGPARWEIHRPPDGGARSGIIAGAPLRGKTGAAYMVATQSSLATVDGRRICAWLVGSPQFGAMPVFSGQVPVFGSGMHATLHVLRMGAAIVNSRSEWMGHTAYVDEKKRTRAGRGFSVITPDWPAIGILVDEFPKITGVEIGTENAKEAVRLASMIVRESRKTGVFLVVLTQTPDLEQLGAREVREILADSNVLALKCDKSSGDMIGITADPRSLPDDYGYGYFKSVDALPSTIMTVHHLKEDHAEETDVFDLLTQADALPLDLGEPVLRALTPFGYPGGNWSFGDADVPGDLGAFATPSAPGPVPQGVPGMLPVQEVLDLLMSRDHATWAQMTEATGQPLEAVQATTAELATHGQLVDLGEGHWRLA
jgi:hypothetical protein